MTKSVLVTGALGGIGKALCKVFFENDYRVIGLDLQATENIPNTDVCIALDLNRYTIDNNYREEQNAKLAENCDGLVALVNNAAVQILGGSNEIQISDWSETLSVNLTAPMLLSQWALPNLIKNEGSIINISSIHQNLTKPRFVSYATSKSALVGLTKAMAVDLSGKVRVNCISPAAIETDMLRAGFENNEEALLSLKKLHPVQRIGYPEEVARLALFLASEEAKFINGANLQLDGGISSVLHDLV
ncbi:MAG: SDR family oxidoreductase [bacterium]|nr:SDR family oxidoreductase [bacterium]